MVAAALVPGSDLLLKNVGLNRTRQGIIQVLLAMGAKLTILNPRQQGGEDVGDVRVCYAGRLRGIAIPEDLVPSLIDEIPVILSLAAVSEGITSVRGAAELRVKESDRLDVMARGLEVLGVSLRQYEDGIDITGGIVGSGTVDGAGDHRCAMSFAVLGQVASGDISIRGAENINTSFPSFCQDMVTVGGGVKNV